MGPAIHGYNLQLRRLACGLRPAVCAEDMESDKCHLSGIIVRDLAAKVSNYRASQSLDEYLKAQVRAWPACEQHRAVRTVRCHRIRLRPSQNGFTHLNRHRMTT